MACSNSRKPGLSDIATAWADLRELQHRLAIVEQQRSFLLRAIDAKSIEIDRLEYPEIREALEHIVKCKV